MQAPAVTVQTSSAPPSRDVSPARRARSPTPQCSGTSPPTSPPVPPTLSLKSLQCSGATQAQIPPQGCSWPACPALSQNPKGMHQHAPRGLEPQASLTKLSDPVFCKAGTVSKGALARSLMGGCSVSATASLHSTCRSGCSSTPSIAGYDPYGCGSADSTSARPFTGSCSSSASALPPPIDVDATTISTAIQDLLEQRDRIKADLKVSFDARCEDRLANLITRERAVQTLMATLDRQLAGIPATNIDQDKWRSLLKGVGVYSKDDTVGFESLLQLYVQTLCTLRDCFAPPELLRNMRKVLRSADRLKDHYDSFEFRVKDGLGKIYRCRDSASKETRCCRQIRKDKASVPIDRLRQSLSRLQALNHTQVPRVYEHLEDFHNFYVLLAPPEGEELLDFIQSSHVQERGLNEALVASTMRQVLDAVAYCHSRVPEPVLHRDIGPDCMLLTLPRQGDGAHAFPRVTITGFGLQALFDLQNTGTGAETVPTCNSPEFLAPEALWRYPGTRCDIWACGCLMFLLLTGAAPFGRGTAIREMTRNAAAAEPDWKRFKHVSTSALSLCRRMLMKDDTARPCAVECLRHPWLAVSGKAQERIPRELRTETLTALMRFHAHSKLQQVLMNVVAAELKVSRIRTVPSIFCRLDPQGSGYVTPTQLETALVELGVSMQSVEQVLQAWASEDPMKVPYEQFVAGCVDLVDDKLDHMLWKVFGMVDEDHSGEVSTVVLAHFLNSVWAENETNDDGSPTSTIGDVERYFRGVLEPGLSVPEMASRIAGGRTSVTFEAIKDFLLDASSFSGGCKVIPQQQCQGAVQSMPLVVNAQTSPAEPTASTASTAS